MTNLGGTSGKSNVQPPEWATHYEQLVPISPTESEHLEKVSISHNRKGGYIVFREEYNVDLSLLDKLDGEPEGYYDLVGGSLPYLQKLRQQEGVISYGQTHTLPSYNFTPTRIRLGTSPVCQSESPTPCESPQFNFQTVSWPALPIPRSAHQNWTETVSQRSPTTTRQPVQSSQQTNPVKRWASVLASGIRKRRSTKDDQTTSSSDRKNKEPSAKSPVLGYCENAVVDIAENTKQRGKQYVKPLSVTDIEEGALYVTLVMLIILFSRVLKFVKKHIPATSGSPK